MIRQLVFFFLFPILVTTARPLPAQATKNSSEDWLDRQMQGLEQTLDTPERDTDANQPLDDQHQQDRDAYTANFEHQQAVIDHVMQSTVSSFHIDIRVPQSDQSDPLLREIDLKQQELAEEYENYQIAYRQIHNMTDKWIPLFESLMARGEMYQANVIAPPEDPAVRLAKARKQVQESRADKDKAAVRIWELRRDIARLRQRLWSRPDQTPFDAIETDVVDDEKLNLYLSLQTQGLDLPTETVVPSARQRATEQALAEATGDQEDVQTQVAQEVAELMQAYLDEDDASAANTEDRDEATPREDEPLVEEEQLAQDVNDILSGDDPALENPEVRQLCDNILQTLKESRKAGEKVIEYLDESGQITTVIDGVETVVQIQDIVQTTKELNETAGEDVAMAYLSARVAALVAKSVGGMYEAAGVYLQIGAKTLQVGGNVVAKATLGPNREVPVHKVNFGPNKAIRAHSEETDQGLRAVNVAVNGETKQVEIYFWKQIYIDGQDGRQIEAWVPYDDLGNPCDYVFLVTSKPYALGLLGEYDMDVYQADTQQVDTTGQIAIKAKGSYKN